MATTSSSLWSAVLCLIVASMYLVVLAPSAAHSNGLQSWHHDRIGTETAWEHATGDDVTVAVIDSGVDATHPALAPNVTDGLSYVPASDSQHRPAQRLGHHDPVGHGTAIAGLIAAQRDSPTPGVAPDATVLPVRVLDDENKYHDATTVATAIEWAVQNDADIINLSLGGSRSTYALAEALEYADNHGVLVIACTGNSDGSGDSEIWYPGRDPLTVAVTGVGPDGERWPTAVTGEAADLAAPSAKLRVPAPDGGYRRATGTSFSTALVSGAAALLREAHPQAGVAELRHMLLASATGGPADLGSGMLDIPAALESDTAAFGPGGVSSSARRMGMVELLASGLAVGFLVVTAVCLRPRRRAVSGAGS